MKWELKIMNKLLNGKEKTTPKLFLQISMGGRMIVNTQVPEDYTIQDMVVVLKRPGNPGEKDRIISVK